MVSEPTRDERLAALKAKRAEVSADSEPSPAPPPSPTQGSPVAEKPLVEDSPSPGLLQALSRATLTGATRLATAGASIVSFAAMVVAMGPLTGSGDETSAEPAPADDPVPSTTPPPTQPNVVIEVVPNYVSADGSAVPPAELAATEETVNLGTTSESSAPQATTQAPTAAPTQATPVPTTIPAPAGAPNQATPAPTAAPTTAAPAPTVAPTTAAPPPTAAPTTTAPPPTAAPTTAPPAPPS